MYCFHKYICTFHFQTLLNSCWKSTLSVCTQTTTYFKCQFELMTGLVCFAIFASLLASRIQIDYCFCISENFWNNTSRDFWVFIFVMMWEIYYQYTVVIIPKIFLFNSSLGPLLDELQIHFTKHKLKILRLTRAVRPLWRVRWLPDTILICTIVVFTWSLREAITFCTVQLTINTHFVWCACKIAIHRLKGDFTGRTWEKHKDTKENMQSHIDEFGELNKQTGK